MQQHGVIIRSGFFGLQIEIHAGSRPESHLRFIGVGLFQVCLSQIQTGALTAQVIAGVTFIQVLNGFRVIFLEKTAQSQSVKILGLRIFRYCKVFFQILNGFRIISLLITGQADQTVHFRIIIMGRISIQKFPAFGNCLVVAPLCKIDLRQIIQNVGIKFFHIFNFIEQGQGLSVIPLRIKNISRIISSCAAIVYTVLPQREEQAFGLFVPPCLHVRISQTVDAIFLFPY